MHGEKTRRKLHKNATCSFEQILEATPHSTTALWLLTWLVGLGDESQTNKDIQDIAGKAKKLISDILLCTLHMDILMLVGWPAGQQKLTSISSLQTLDTDWKTCQE